MITNNIHSQSKRNINLLFHISNLEPGLPKSPCNIILLKGGTSE